MKIGLIKSKVEKILVESMSDNTFKDKIKTFKSLVLEDKNIAKAFYLYDIMDRKKGLNKEDADLFINECIRQYEKLNLPHSKIQKLQEWSNNTKIESNQYEDIDNIFNEGIQIENILESKKQILKRLSSPEKKSEISNIPISKVYEIAESTTKEYLSDLSENELKTLNKYLTLTESEIVSKYDLLSEMVIEKLESVNSDSNIEIKNKINETIEKIKTEPKNQINLMKLRQLFNSI